MSPDRPVHTPPTWSTRDRVCAPITMRALCATALALCVTGCGADSPAGSPWSVAVDTLPSGVVHVTNSPPASGIEPTWVIEPELTIGALEGEGPDVFGQIKGIAPLDDDRIAVLDAQAQEIRIFGPDGEHLRTFGGQGAGPGELNDANGLLVGPDGLIRVNDPRNNRLSFFDPDSGFVRSERIETGAFAYVWTATIDSTGRTLERTLLTDDGGERWSVIKVYDSAGIWTDTVRLEGFEVNDDPPGVYRYANRLSFVPFWPRGASALDPRGFFWRRPPDVNAYRIVQTTWESDTLRVFESRRPALPVTAAERDSAIDAIRESAGGEQLDWSRIPDEKPIVESIMLDDRGRVWVKVLASDTLLTYDVFDRDGRYRGTAVTALDLPGYLDPVVVGDRFYTVVTDELDVPFVVRARIRAADRGERDG